MLDGVRFVETENEFSASYQLRYKVYVECMGRLKDKGDHAMKELRDEQDKNARAVIAVKNNQPIGTLRLFWGGDAPFSKTLIEAYQLKAFSKLLEEKQVCIVERLIVDHKYRGSATVLRMYKRVMNFVLEHQAEVVLLNSEPQHVNSYLKIGFRPFSKKYHYPGIGPVIPMALIAGDYEHLKRVGSPFSVLVSKDDLNYCHCIKELKKIIKPETNVINHPRFNYTEAVNDLYNSRSQYIERANFASKLKMKLNAY